MTRIKKLHVVLLALAVGHCSHALGQQLDSYGGLASLNCPHKTGRFQTEKIGTRWWFCDPEGKAFFMQGVYVVAPAVDVDSLGSSYYARVAKKYGDNGPRWAEATIRRLKSWGFNTLGPYSSTYTLPTHKEAIFEGDHSQPEKMPFIAIVRPAYYSMINVNGYLDENSRVKNILYGKSPFYTGYAPGTGIADYFDPGIAQWLSSAFQKDNYWREIRDSKYLPYLIGINCDDSDQMYGFGATDVYATSPPGHNNNHLSWVIATMSPLQTANRDKEALYSNTSVTSKQAWIETVKTKYQNIENLNRAWGADYSTFDTSGFQVRGEAVAIGDGSNRAFHSVLRHLRISRFTVQIKLDGKPIAGDTGDGLLYGPQIDPASSIDYGSGTISLVFREGRAPKNGSTITADYVQNGWEIGTGLLDEDGRKAHQKWLGSDFGSLRDSRPEVRSDLNTFLKLIAGHFFKTCSEGIKAAFPQTLYLGPDTLGGWSVPSRAEVLQSASQFIDVIGLGGRSSLTPEMMNYVFNNFGDKPYYEAEFFAANPDSAFFRFPNNSDIGMIDTQAERGATYFRTLSSLREKSVHGTQPYIGTLWWQFADNWPEKLNWGLVTPLDDAYDGREAQRSPGKDEFGYPTGGEERDYGDALTLIKRANREWIQKSAPAPVALPKH